MPKSKVCTFMSNLHCPSILLSRSKATVRETLWHRLQNPGAAPARTARRWAPAPARAAPWAPWRRRRPPPPRAAPARPAPSTPASCRCLRGSQNYGIVLHITAWHCCAVCQAPKPLRAQRPAQPAPGTPANLPLPARHHRRPALQSAFALHLHTCMALLRCCAACNASEAHLRQAAISAPCLQPRRQPVTSACLLTLTTARAGYLYIGRLPWCSRLHAQCPFHEPSLSPKPERGAPAWSPSTTCGASEPISARNAPAWMWDGRVMPMAASAATTSPDAPASANESCTQAAHLQAGLPGSGTVAQARACVLRPRSHQNVLIVLALNLGRFR